VRLVDHGKGSFTIRNAYDGLAMDGPLTEAGAMIWFPYHGQPQQRFQSERGFVLNNQPYWLVPARVEGGCDVGRLFRRCALVGVNQGQGV
jgi:hypothetical protein